MTMKAITAAAALLALGLMTQPGVADEGLPDDPMSNENTIPAPHSDIPTDPAANDNPSARTPTAPSGSSQYEMKKEGSVAARRASRMMTTTIPTTTEPAP